jgi:hypothetical protein
MPHSILDLNVKTAFCYETFQELVEACVRYYHNSLEEAADADEVAERRHQLAFWVRKFYEESGTLSSSVEESLDKLEDPRCLLVVTAHQPNLFAYGGVLRKAVLAHVLANKLSTSLSLPVVSFFGIADQDFTDDRWVRTAQLPDVERRAGVLELRAAPQPRMMLNKVPKPSTQVLESWKNSVRSWVLAKSTSINKFCRENNLGSLADNVDFMINFDSFWKIVEESYSHATSYSDFSGFLMSRVVNDVWGCNTLFARFSECQQIFGREFAFILSNFDRYSASVGETVHSAECQASGAYEREPVTIPFWIHCDCGSKARLMAEWKDERLFGLGKCVGCGRDYEFDFNSGSQACLSKIVSDISARSLPLPLILFKGLRPCSYIGGAGGREYLRQARHVARKLEVDFPPVAIWRPRDRYRGLGQLDALIVFRRLSGSFDLARYVETESRLKKTISAVQESISRLDEEKESAKRGMNAFSETEDQKKQKIKAIKAISIQQMRARAKANFSGLVRSLGLLENVKKVMDVYPSMIDYAVNIGLGNVGDQWVQFLEKDGSLVSDVKLETGLDRSS